MTQPLVEIPELEAPGSRQSDVERLYIYADEISKPDSLAKNSPADAHVVINRISTL